MMHCLSYLLAVIVLLSCPWPAWGNEFRLVPSVSVKEEYNNNILFQSQDIRKDFITTISPGLEMVNKTERLDTDLLVRLDRIEYADNRELNATDQTYKGKFRYLATSLFDISAEAEYVKDSRSDRDIGTSGIVLSTVPRNRSNASLLFNYRLNEKTAAMASYAFGRNDYDSARYVDDVSHYVNAGMVHDLSRYLERVKGRFNVGYSDYGFSDSRIDTVTGTLGFSWDFSETWTIQVDGGIRHTWSDLSAYPLKIKNDGWGWVGLVSLDYKGERGSGSLAYKKDIAPASGLNGAADRDTLTLSTRYRVTYEFYILLTAGYYTNKSEAMEYSTRAIDERTFRINPGVRYEFTKDIAIDAFYDYTAFDNLTSNIAANRSLVFVRLSIQHPLFE